MTPFVAPTSTNGVIPNRQNWYGELYGEARVHQSLFKPKDKICASDDENLDTPLSQIGSDTRMLNAAVAFFPFLQMSLKSKKCRPEDLFCKFRTFWHAPLISSSAISHFVTHWLNHAFTIIFLYSVFDLNFRNGPWKIWCTSCLSYQSNTCIGITI